ncbi:MAG TPA: HlyD family efflux transporter periplasmic adaptor subunit [Gemmatimonadaceae bacterium]|nr:HlyD family efflux transporter periplasmic adaptor subunit [Gemmatimonadaceae bacterium]
MPDPIDPPPFFDAEPPHWAARGLAYALIALFAAAALFSVAVQVPESVSGRFTLVPVSGTDPIRASRRGMLVEVRVPEGETVGEGDTLFVLSSEPFGDRFAELGSLRAQVDGASRGAANLRSQFESQRRADEEEARRLAARADYLARTSDLQRRQLALARELAERHREGVAGGSVSTGEYTARQLDADRLAVELELAESEHAESAAAAEKLRHESAARAAQHREALRRLESGAEEARIRIAALERELATSARGELTVVARCAGTVLRLRVGAAGAVVQEGDVLGELACAGEQLLGELTVAQAGLARLRPGQSVKLLYDAFPYQRYGVRHGTIRWVGPPGMGAAEHGAAPAFRALVDLADSAVRVRGETRVLMPGMSGTGSVIVGRRTLVSYAFEPIRQLRESFAEPPS